MFDKYKIYSTLCHFCLSLLIILLFTTLAIYLWFPYPLYLIDGTLRAILILALVDLCLGPLLTFIVASSKKTKKELIFDILVILIFQLSALGFGILKIYDQQVIAMVYIDGAFHLVSKHQAEKNLDEGDINLPKFGNIYYGMLLSNEVASMKSSEVLKKMYNLVGYKKLEKLNGQYQRVPKKYIPLEIDKLYGENFSFVLVAGKQRNGIAIIDKNNKIIDIYVSELI